MTHAITKIEKLLYTIKGRMTRVAGLFGPGTNAGQLFAAVSCHVINDSENCSTSFMGGQLLMTHPQMRILFISLLAMAVGPVAVRAQVKLAAPIPGILGTIKTITSHSVEIETKTGVVHVETKEPFTTYQKVPSDLSQVTTSSYVAVVSEKQEDGTEVAKMITIFPAELRGTAEGSVLMDADPGETNRSRMTNGSVSRPTSKSRMTNGTVQKGSGTTLMVHYQDGVQTISVPANIPVTKFAPGKAALAAGDTVYVETAKRPDGTLTTDKILLLATGASGS